jgi:tetraacyldisaccharide-1-P 4'-kinase
LSDADAIVLDGSTDAGTVSEIRSHARADVPVFTMVRQLGPPQWIGSPGPPLAAGTPVLALSGIADPSRFAASLRAAGFHVVRELTFADHHRYDARDLKRIADATIASGAAVVLTTEKDAVRLLPCRPLPVAFASVPLEVTIEPADAFRAWLLDRLGRVRACR